MSQPFLGEIRLVSFNFAPKGWALCNGQLLSINQNQALFSILGTTYGGDGRVTFGLPDFRDRAPMHFGSGHVLGELGGERTHTLGPSEMPTHTHIVNGRAVPGNTGAPVDALWAGSAKPAYSDAPNVSMNPASVASTGSGQPHANMPPYLSLNFVIALVGIFPSQN